MCNMRRTIVFTAQTDCGVLGVFTYFVLIGKFYIHKHKLFMDKNF